MSKLITVCAMAFLALATSTHGLTPASPFFIGIPGPGCPLPPPSIPPTQVFTVGTQIAVEVALCGAFAAGTYSFSSSDPTAVISPSDVTTLTPSLSAVLRTSIIFSTAGIQSLRVINASNDIDRSTFVDIRAAAPLAAFAPIPSLNPYAILLLSLLVSVAARQFVRRHKR
jgi:hypothetical protein